MTSTLAAPAPTAARTVAVELRPLPGGRTLLTSVSGRHFTLDVDAATALRLLDAAHEPARASASLPPDWPDAAEALGRLTERLAAEDRPRTASSLTDPPEPVTLPAGVRWLVHGDAEVAAAVVAALAPGADVEVYEGPLHEAVHRAFARRAVLLEGVRGHAATVLTAADRACADARVPWIPVVCERGRLEAGPRVTPGTGATYEDYVARRIAAAGHEETARALLTPALGGDCGPAPERLGPLFARVLDLVAHDAAFGVGDLVLAADAGAAEAGEIERHRVLPLPGPRGVHRPQPADALCDPLTGIVTRVRSIRHHASVPAALRTAQADVAIMRRVSRWANSTSCQGSAFDDPLSARAAAIGEAAERYCGNMLDTLPVEYGSHRALARGPERFLDPADLVLYSDRQYAARGFPFRRLDADLDVHWVPGRSVTRGEPVWVPASMVYVNWFTAGYSAAPVTNFCPFAGIAAGPDLDFAVRSALAEVIERHATMVWWLNAQPLPRVALGPAHEAWWTPVRPAGQRPELIALDNEFGVPVAAGVLWNEPDRLLNIGFSARPTLEAAAGKAWTEALTLQEGSRDLLGEGGRHWGAMRRGELNGRSFKPWRADRRYLDDFRPDLRDCDDLMVQQQVHLDPRSLERVRPLVDTPMTRTLADVADLPGGELTDYLDHVHAAGLEVIVVDITSADVAATGMRVVRVIVPGTVGNAPAAFPFLGGARVQDLAVELGWRERARAEEELNYFPLPHA